MGNLRQIGVALTSYTGDYTGYLPSWPAWYNHTQDPYDGRPDALHFEYKSARPPNPGGKSVVGLGYHKDHKDRVATAPYAASTWRLIAWAVNRSNLFGTPGDLNLAPHGIGMLLVGGYLSDASIYYCPSSDGMRADNYGEYRLSHWKLAGGFGAETMLYGAWGANRGIGYVEKVSSHYAYRGVPLINDSGWTAADDRSGIYELLGTKPRIKAHQGGPYFRTMRELAGRALLSDTFSKGLTYDVNGTNWSSVNGSAIENSRPIVGFGMRGHRSGVNILYGDGRATWWGDPQESLIWHTKGCDTGSGPVVFLHSQYGYFNNCFYGHSDRPFDATDTINGSKFPHTALSVWHEFDVSGDIDVTAQ